MEIDTIDLHNRPASEVIEILRPMVQQGGSISGTGYKLILKSTPQNIEQIKNLLADIDAAAMQLLISVSMDRRTIVNNQQQAQNISIQNGDGSISVGNSSKHTEGASVHINNDKIKYDARIFENRTRQESPAIQQVRVTEGLWATISTGQAIPIATRQRNADGTVTETINYQHITSGFQVMPRVNGNNVMLSIRPQQQNVSPQGGGVFDATGMETTINGKMNEWIQLGGVVNQHRASQQGITYSTRVRDADQSQIWVKVEQAK